MHIHDILIIGAGPAGLAVAARLYEQTPSATFTDDEHNRYHWIRKHGLKMNIKNYRTNKDSMSKAPRSSHPDPSPRGSRPSFGASAHPDLDLVVLDADGADWLSRWTRLFRTFAIPTLRSPLFFHIDPSDRDALLAYAHATGREAELVALRGCAGKELSKHRRKQKVKLQRGGGGGRAQRGAVSQSGADVDERDRRDYYAPSAGVFEAHCRDVVGRYGLGGLVRREVVVDVAYEALNGGDGRRDSGAGRSARESGTDEDEDEGEDEDEDGEERKVFRVQTNKGVHHAHIVVLAVGAGLAPSLPRIPGLPATPSPHPGFSHAMQLPSYPPPAVAARVKAGMPTAVLIVGGGLTSVQLADLAVRRGVRKVHLLMRGEVKVKHFDVDLEWVGKYRNVCQASFWSADDDEERLQMLLHARNGGSIPPTYRKLLTAHIASGAITLHTHTTLTSVSWDPSMQLWSCQLATTTPPSFTSAPSSASASGSASEPASDSSSASATSPSPTNLEKISHITLATTPSLPNPSSPLPPLLHTLSRTHPIPLLSPPVPGGPTLPALTHDMQWSPSVPLFVNGALAGLRVGPGAGNLGGMRVGAERVVWNVGDVLSRVKGRRVRGGEGGGDGGSSVGMKRDGGEKGEDRAGGGMEGKLEAWVCGRGGRFDCLGE